MASTAQKREWWADWLCNTDKMVRVAFPGEDGREYNLLVADKSAPAWELFAALMRKHSYYFRELAGGTYNCRKIRSSGNWSMHAYGLALDLNPSVNSYGQNDHDYPPEFIADVEATGLFRWGQVFDDPMHWEIDVPPDAIEEELMPFTQHEEDVLKQIVAALDEVGSNGTFAKYTVQHLRNHPKPGMQKDEVTDLATDLIERTKHNVT